MEEGARLGSMGRPPTSLPEDAAHWRRRRPAAGEIIGGRRTPERPRVM